VSSRAPGGGSGAAIEIAVKERVLALSLANPPDNRLTPSMVKELADALSWFESDDLDLLVITGSGRTFSKGFDVAALKAYRDPSELRSLLVLANTVFSRLARCPKPTLAAISGACLGGGLELAMACHFRVCAEKARLGLPEVWINLIPGLGGFHRLARLVGPTKALELVALGDLITAEEALRLNLVSRVLPGDGFAECVAAFVRALTAANPRVMREVLRLAACSADPGEDERIREATDTFVALWSCLPRTT
jgi:enoyl-CoA hydratase